MVNILYFYEYSLFFVLILKTIENSFEGKHQCVLKKEKTMNGKSKTFRTFYSHGVFFKLVNATIYTYKV